jgi:hypothetical protein
MACDDKVSFVPTLEDDEDLVDYSSTPEWMNLEINVVHLFVDGSVPTEEDLAHLDFCDNPPRKIPYYRLRPIHFGH